MSTAANITTTDPETATHAHCLALVEQAGRVPEIRDDETNGKAGDLVKFIGAALKKRNELRDARVRPLNEQVRAINATFKPLDDQLLAAKTSVKAKQTAYIVAKEAEIKRLAREAAAKAQEAALEAATKAEAMGDTVSAEKALEAAVTAPTAVSVVARGDYGSTASLRSVWSFRVTDFAALPDAYKLPNEQALGALARSGRPTIAGVEWIESKQAVTR